MRRRWVGTVAAGIALGTTFATSSRAARGQPGVAALAAPRPAPVAAPRSSRPRGVALRLRPRVGDTVRTRFEQTVRLMPRGTAGSADVVPASAMLVIARSIVERVDDAGAFLLAVTDSVAFRAPGAPAAAVERMRRGMQGRRAEMHVAPDGALAASDGVAGGLPAGLAGGAVGVVASLRLPGTLPATVVAPGARWRRAMAVPAWGPAAAPPHLDVAFRFDSMTADESRAYISLRGRVHGAATPESDDDLLPGTMGAAEPGRVEGALVVDLARGWVVESWATFRLNAVLVSAPGAAPAPVWVVVTQRLRAY